jgi:hypothetical protein
MRTLRLAPVVLLASALALAASPAQAADGGCPPVFQLAPVSILGDNVDGQVDNVNHDGFICVRTITKGYVIFVDNVHP